MNRTELNTASEKYAYDTGCDTTLENLQEAFIAGARWREDQIMKGVPINSDERLLHILECCCKVCHVSVEEACSNSRIFNVVLARQMYFYIARENTSLRLKDIGKVVNLSHPAVCYHLFEIKNRFREKDNTYLDTYNSCLKECEQSIAT